MSAMLIHHSSTFIQSLQYMSINSDLLTHTHHIVSYQIISYQFISCHDLTYDFYVEVANTRLSPPEPSSAVAVVSPWRHDLISFLVLPRCTSCTSCFFRFLFGAPELHMLLFADFLAGHFLLAASGAL